MSASLLIAILTQDISIAALDIVKREGIHGATTLPAAGLSHHSMKTFFGLTIQQPMSIHFWIAESEITNKVAKVLNDELQLDSPKQGLALTLPIDRLYGLQL